MRWWCNAFGRVCSAASGSYGELLDYVIFAVMIFYVLTIIGLFILRRKRPDAERPYKAFGYPVIPAIYVIAASFIALNLLISAKTRAQAWPGLLIVLMGIPVYFWWRRNPGSKARTLLRRTSSHPSRSRDGAVEAEAKIAGIGITEPAVPATA